jgi:hypothetical protein
MSYQNQPVPINLYSSNLGQLPNNLPFNPGPFRNQDNASEDSSVEGQNVNPPPSEHSAGFRAPGHGFVNYGQTGNILPSPHFLESRVVLPPYNPEPFGWKPVKIKSQSKGLMFDGTNMDISDSIKRLEYAAQIDGALGSDIALQIIFFLEGKTLVKEVQEMAEKENHDWERLKERMVLRWGKMMPLLKHTRNDLDQLLATTCASGIKTQREFQNFRIKIDNLVAYLIGCQHMGKAEEI